MAIYIRSNNPDGRGEYHLAVTRELTGERTGKIYKTYYVTACSGKKVGGVWGYSVTDSSTHEQPRHVCRRCAAKAALAEFRA